MTDEKMSMQLNNQTMGDTESNEGKVIELKKSRLHKIINGVFLTIFIAAMVLYIGANLYFRVPVKDYYKTSNKAFLIAGLNTGFVPQGLDYDKRSNQFFVTGYYDAKPCRIYRIDKDNELQGEVSLNYSDGSDFISHAGGLAIHGDYVYVAGGFDNCLYVFGYKDIMNAPMGGEVNCIGKVDLNRNSDYLTVACIDAAEDGIYIAEFYREQNYPTSDKHHITTTGGAENKALALKFDYSDESTAVFGISKKPAVAISLPDLVQGIEVIGNEIYLSTSYAVAKSGIYHYDAHKADKGVTIDVFDETLPLLELDKDSLVKLSHIAPMSEEIVIVDGKMHVMTESASNKYVFGKLTGGEFCYATDMSYFR